MSTRKRRRLANRNRQRLVKEGVIVLTAVLLVNAIGEDYKAAVEALERKGQVLVRAQHLSLVDAETFRQYNLPVSAFR